MVAAPGAAAAPALFSPNSAANFGGFRGLGFRGLGV